MTPVKLRDVKKGEFFTKKPYECPSDTQVWIKGDYDRSLKKYSCTRCSDFCDEQFISPDKDVYIDFIY